MAKASNRPIAFRSLKDAYLGVAANALTNNNIRLLVTAVDIGVVATRHFSAVVLARVGGVRASRKQ